MKYSPASRTLARLFALLGFFAICVFSGAGAATTSVLPDADTFVRASDPNNNFGSAGALSVSGPTAQNGFGTQNGAYDTLIRFPAGNAVAALDQAIGSHDWLITGASLLLTEVTAPSNPIFNWGSGGFEVRWQSADAWLEGTGKPTLPTTDGVTWNSLPQFVNASLDRSLCVFTNAFVNGQQSFSLAIDNQFAADIQAGGEVSLHLLAASPNIGFTFHSREYSDPTSHPTLALTALPNPHPVVSGISNSGPNVVISFNIPSIGTNWQYHVQRALSLVTNTITPSVTWSNVLDLPHYPSAASVNYTEPRTSAQAFYRLLVTP